MAELLRDRYEPREPPQRDRSSQVVRAWDHLHSRWVALKVWSAGGGAHETLLSGARSLLTMSPHPALAVPRDDFFAGDSYVLVMDWVNGTSLDQLLAQPGDPGLGTAAVLGWLGQLASALDHLHSHDPPIVHGDVRPGNLIITPRGDVVLVGFGGAVARGGVPDADTAEFVAPEVAEGDTPTPAADVYGLAATANTLLTRSPPSAVRPVGEGPAAAAAAVERALRRALSVDPSERPASAGRLIDLLRASFESSPPTGVVTFCLTDIEGSTALWQAHPNGMAEALTRHGALISETVHATGGFLVRAQAEGDSSLSVFEKASDAARCALQLQQRLAAEQWPEGIRLRVRIGLHTGEAQLVEGEYHGTTVNRAARIRGLAAGGQTFVSRVTAELLADALGPGSLLRDVGEWELKGLSRPDRVFELSADAPPGGPRESAVSLAPSPSTARPDANVRRFAAVSAAGLLERQEVADAMADLVGQALAGHGGALFVVAQPGLGKTAILEYGRRLAPPSARVGVAQGDAMETALPFGLLSQVLDSLGEPDVLRQPSAHDSAGDARAAQFYGTMRWLERFATSPVLLAVDDLHWADADSLALLSFICRRISSLPIAVFGTLRPWPSAAEQVAIALAQAGRARMEELHPLSDDTARSLVLARVERFVPDEVCRRALDLCAGNPLLLEQVALLIARGKELPEPRRETSSQISEDMLLARFAGFDMPALRWARAASVLGTRFSADLASELAELDDREIDDVLQPLFQSGLVRQGTGGSVEFMHPLVGQALYESLAPPARSRLHRRAFGLLKSRGMEAEAAEHAIRGKLIGDEGAITLLQSSGRAAMRVGALATAVAHLDGAVELAADHPPVTLLLTLAEALFASGQSGRAITVCTRLLEHAEISVAARAQALRMLGRALFLRGAREKGAARFEEAVEVGEQAEPAAAVHALLDNAMASWQVHGPVRALPLVVRARELASRTSGQTRVRAEAAWGYISFQSGDGRGLEATTEAAKVVEADPVAYLADLAWPWGAINTFGNANKYAERFTDAERVIRRALASAERVGAPEAIAWLAITHCDTMMRMGQLDRALELAERCTALAELAPGIRPFGMSAHAYLLLLLGRLPESDAWCDSLEKIATHGGWVPLLWLWHTQGLRHLHDGRTVQACEVYARVEAAANALGVGEPCVVPWARAAISAYLGCGRDDAASRVIAWLEGCAEGLPCRWPRIVAATGRAGLARRSRDDRSADEHFRRALVLHTEVELPLERVTTLTEYGAFLRDAGQAAQARALLTEALAIAKAAGAHLLARRAGDELSAAGGRPRRRREPRQLSAQQARVAQLQAIGLSVQEIAAQLELPVEIVAGDLESLPRRTGNHIRRRAGVVEQERRSSCRPTSG